MEMSMKHEARTKRRTLTLTDAIGAGEYEPDHKASIPQRIAHFLDWAAGKFPKTYAPYNYVLKAVMGYSKLPRLDSEEVERVRSKLTRVREILQEKFARELDSQPGVGIRATVDDADALTVALPKKMKRLKSAKAGVAKTAALIDSSKLPNTAEMAPWKKWFNTDVKTIVKTLSSPDFEKKLLPPKSDE